MPPPPSSLLAPPPRPSSRHPLSSSCLSKPPHSHLPICMSLVWIYRERERTRKDPNQESMGDKAVHLYISNSNLRYKCDHKILPSHWNYWLTRRMEACTHTRQPSLNSTCIRRLDLNDRTVIRYNAFILHLLGHRSKALQHILCLSVRMAG